MAEPSRFEIYSVYVQTITANEQRRQQASVIYLTLIAAGVALLGSSVEVEPAYVFGPTTVISLIWFLTINYFRALAKAKFAVINELEAGWEIEPFAKEWEALNSGSKPLRMKYGLTHLEMFVPFAIFAFGLGYFTKLVVDYLCA